MTRKHDFVYDYMLEYNYFARAVELDRIMAREGETS